MSFLFDEAYYLGAKLAQLRSAGITDAEGGKFTLTTLREAIADADMTIWEHYERYGRSEGLNPNAYFNEKEYLEAKLRQLQSTEPGAAHTMESLLIALDGAGLSPLEHYARYGAYETDANGLSINPSNAYYQVKLTSLLFDEAYYLDTKLAQLRSAGITDAEGGKFTLTTLREAIADAGMTVKEHYARYGRSEGLNPNAYFNEKEYLEAKLRQLQSTEPEVDHTMESLLSALDGADLSPLEHYARYGAYETDANGLFINPSNAFDANAYYQAKLLSLHGSDFSVNGHSGRDITMTDVLDAFRSGELSPVAHYLAYGAMEVTANGLPLVQTVPVSQRVPNDIFREALGEIVPTNYNPATPAPESVSTPQAPAKPADVGGKVPSSASPDILRPASSAFVPGDEGYMAPPTNLTDSNEHPVVAPTTSGTGNATDYWAVVSMQDGSAALYDNTGAHAGNLDPGSVDTGSGIDLVIPATPVGPDPNPGPVPEPAPAPVHVTATTGADAVTFYNRAADVFTTALRQSATEAQYTLDLSQIELKAGCILRIGDFRFSNEAGELNGAALVTALVGALRAPDAQNVPPGWTFAATTGGTLSFTATATGPAEAPVVTYEHGVVAEMQAVNLTGITLAPGQSLTIRDTAAPGAGPTILYTNGTGDDLSGTALATAVAASGQPLTDWTLRAEGSRLYFTSTDPGQDQSPLEVALPYDGGTMVIEAEGVTRYSWESLDVATLVTSGNGGQIAWQTPLTATDDPLYATYAQTLDLTGVSLTPGQTLSFTARDEAGNILLYTNTTGTTLGGTALLNAIYSVGIIGNTWNKFTGGYASSTVNYIEETVTFRSTSNNASPITAQICNSGNPSVYTIDCADITVLPNDGLAIGDKTIAVSSTRSGADLAHSIYVTMRESSVWTPSYVEGSTQITLTSKIPGAVTLPVSSYDMGREACLDFSGMTLAAGERLQIGDYSYTAAEELTGAALADALYADLAGKSSRVFSDATDWTVSHRAGSSSLFLVTDNNRTITVTFPTAEPEAILVSQSSSGGNNPHLSTDFSLSISFVNKTLLAGEDLRIGHYTFTNATGGTLSREALAQAVVEDMLTANAFAVDGATAWAPEYYNTGGYSPNYGLRLSTDGIDVSYSYPDGEHRLDVTETVKGSGESAGQGTPLGLVTVEGGKALVELTSGLNDLDVITGFKVGEDRIVVANAEIDYLVVDNTALRSATYEGFRYVCNEGLSYSVGANQAGLFALEDDCYLLVNDGTAAFDPDKDIVIKLVGMQGYSEHLQLADIFG